MSSFYLSDKVAVQPGRLSVLPAQGAGNPLQWNMVGGVGRIFKKLTVTEATAVQPGDGEVQVSLTR